MDQQTWYILICVDLLLLQPNVPLQWRHNERGSISNHQHVHCLLNCRFRCRSKKTAKLRVTSLCAGILPVAGEFPAQKSSYAKNVSIWWRHHVSNSFEWYLEITSIMSTIKHAEMAGFREITGNAFLIISHRYPCFNRSIIYLNFCHISGWRFCLYLITNSLIRCDNMKYGVRSSWLWFDIDWCMS